MAKKDLAQKIFVCTKCDAQFQKWNGRCLECGAWGTIKESVKTPDTKRTAALGSTTKIETLDPAKRTVVVRHKTKIEEADRVLGGGIVPGSLILLGGEPGIGKSTLALHIAQAIPNTLYLSGEESVEQIALRAKRLGIKGNISFANETNTDNIATTIRSLRPSLAIVDSIQTISSPNVTGEPGNPNQIRASAVTLLDAAKQSGTAILIIGHVTKDGTVAGPKTLEHLVDTVLYFEGDEHHALRILRATKNRFGASDEIGVFEMVEEGLREVPNPSALLLEERGEVMSGSVVTCLMEGTRPILVEVQALVNRTVFGYPQRKASGFDLNRLYVLAAVLERRAGLKLSQFDIHVNIVGGIKITEPAGDLAICLAIASAYKDKALDRVTVAFGEVGLGGEVRSVPFIEKRVKECHHLGMKRVITHTKKSDGKNLDITNISNLKELISVG